MNLRRFLPSPSMGVALLALAIALGGTAYAANKIGSNQIKKNAITSSKIKKKAVTTAKLSPKAVTNGKLAKDAVKSGKIAGGAVTTDKISDSAVTTGKIADDAVNSSKISDYGRSATGPWSRPPTVRHADTARAAAPPVTLYENGPLTIYAKCFRDTVADNLFGEMYVSTTKEFSIMEGTDDLDGGPVASDYLNAGYA